MIELGSLAKSWDGGASWAVRDLSLAVERGEWLSLLGESGSGKTTTLKMVNRLVEPSAGTIRVDGRDVLAQDPVLLRRSIGYVFQGIGLFPHWTVAQNVGVVPRLLGWDEERVRARERELLELVRLPFGEYAGRRPRELSGGQRQRVGVARALAAEPPVLLMDEPFGALDPLTRDALGEETRALQQRLGVTVVLVTHDVTEALLLSDRIAVLHAGSLLALGTPAALLRDRGHERVAAMLASPRRQAERVERLLRAEERP